MLFSLPLTKEEAIEMGTAFGIFVECLTSSAVGSISFTGHGSKIVIYSCKPHNSELKVETKEQVKEILTYHLLGLDLLNLATEMGLKPVGNYK